MKESGYFSVVMYKDCEMQQFLQQIYYVASAMGAFSTHYEIIVVLREGLDEKSAELFQMAKTSIGGHVMLVTLSQCPNKEWGIKAGVDLAIGDYVYEIEADVNEERCKHMVKMYQVLTEKGCDMVFLRPKGNGILHIAGTKILRQMGNESVVLGRNTMRLVTRRSLNVMDSQLEKENTRNLMYQLCGLKVKHMYDNGHEKHKHGHLMKEMGYFLRAKKIGSKCAYLLSGLYLLIFFSLILVGEMDRAYVVPIFLLSFSILLILLGMLMNHLFLLYRETKNSVCYTVLEVKRLK